MTRMIRVFPRKTKASPDDELAYFGPPDLFAEADAAERHRPAPAWRAFQRRWARPAIIHAGSPKEPT
jgi:hypothetical protein